MMQILSVDSLSAEERQLHETWMRQALIEAQAAADRDEVPVGALVVHEGEILGKGFNQPISSSDPCAHAEIMALRAAARQIQNYRLVGTTLYVTLEPCTMCWGALVHARVESVVFGAKEPKSGALCSQLNLHQTGCYNHQINLIEGVLAEECGQVVSDFFARRRAAKRQLKAEQKDNKND